MRDSVDCDGAGFRNESAKVLVSRVGSGKGESGILDELSGSAVEEYDVGIGGRSGSYDVASSSNSGFTLRALRSGSPLDSLRTLYALWPGRSGIPGIPLFPFESRSGNLFEFIGILAINDYYYVRRHYRTLNRNGIELSIFHLVFS